LLNDGIFAIQVYIAWSLVDTPNSSRSDCSHASNSSEQEENIKLSVVGHLFPVR
jgi:hypothetical protein